MTSQPLRRSPRLAAKTAKKVHVTTTTTTTTTTRSAIPSSILRAPKPTSARSVSSKPSSISPTGLPMGVVVVKFGRNAVAKFEKENPPYEFEPLDDDEVEELFPLPQHGDDDLVVDVDVNVNANTTATATISAIIEEEETRRNEEILSEWEELFDDLTYHNLNRHGNGRGSDDDSGDTDDSEDDGTNDSGHDNEEYDYHHKYHSGATTAHETNCSSGYVDVEDEEIYYCNNLANIASPNDNDSPLLEGDSNGMVPITRVDDYYCDFCKRAVRRSSEYFYA